MANTGVTLRVVSNRIPTVKASLKPLLAAEVQKAAFRIEAASKAKVPVKTATLQRSIHTVMSNDGMTATVGPSVFYAIFVEFGTRRMGARPYMRPAADAVLPGFVGVVRALLGKL